MKDRLIKLISTLGSLLKNEKGTAVPDIFKVDSASEGISNHELDIIKRKALADDAKEKIGRQIDKAFSEGFLRLK